MNNRATSGREDLDVFLGKPNTVPARDVLAQETKAVQITHRGSSPCSHVESQLVRGFLHMDLDPQPMTIRKFARR